MSRAHVEHTPLYNPRRPSSFTTVRVLNTNTWHERTNHAWWSLSKPSYSRVYLVLVPSRACICMRIFTISIGLVAAT